MLFQSILFAIYIYRSVSFSFLYDEQYIIKNLRKTASCDDITIFFDKDYYEESPQIQNIDFSSIMIQKGVFLKVFPPSNGTIE